MIYFFPTKKDLILYVLTLSFQEWYSKYNSMSAFGLNPLNPKCGPLIPLDTSKYDTHFKNNPSKIQCERLKVPYLFLPPDTNTLKNYDKDQFSFTFIENGIHYVNRNELNIPNRYKLMALFHPELFVIIYQRPHAQLSSWG